MFAPDRTAFPLSRRQVLRSAGAGFGYLALAGMLGQAAARGARAARRQRIRSRQSRRTSSRRRGGSSSCSCKGRSRRWTPSSTSRSSRSDGGKPGPGGGTLTASKFGFRQYGETGTWFSELLPHMAGHADKLCWLRGLHTDTPAHPQAVVQLHTGSANAALTRPSMGAWLLYGLGTENQDLPGYVTINPPPNFGGAVNYGSAFLPAHFQGTRINDQGYLPNLKPQIATAQQRRQLELIQAMNRATAADPGRRRKSTASSSPTNWRSGCRGRCPNCSTSRASRRRCSTPTA